MTTPVTQSTVVKLAPLLDLKAAAPLAEELLSMRGSDLKIDASQVERLGSQCLQVLLSARLSWQTDQKTLLIENISEAMQMAAAQLGAETALFTKTETLS